MPIAYNQETTSDCDREKLQARLAKLADNAGQEGALIVREVKKRSGNEGFNVAIGKYENPVKARLVSSIRPGGPHGAAECCSIAALMLTTEALVTEMPEKEKPASGGTGGIGRTDY